MNFLFGSGQTIDFKRIKFIATDLGLWLRIMDMNECLEFKKYRMALGFIIAPMVLNIPN